MWKKIIVLAGGAALAVSLPIVALAATTQDIETSDVYPALADEAPYTATYQYLGDDVVIAHRVLCHGRSIGHRVLLGNGCIVNDGVVIGHDSLAASGALLVDGMDIPPRSVVAGLPARVRREVREEDVARIRGYRDIYVRNTSIYLAEGSLNSPGT